MPMILHLKGSEVKLVEMLNEVQVPLGWQAVHFHLSELIPQYQSEYQIKIAVNLINDLLKNYDGGIFVMNDHSIIVLCYQLEKGLLNKLIFQLRYLYMDDPLAYTEGGEENHAFSTSYELVQDWHEFRDMCSRRMTAAARRGIIDKDRGAKDAPKAAELGAKPPTAFKRIESAVLSVSRLVGIERDLRHTDLSKVVRRQPVCAAMPNTAIRRVFDELYIHIAHLRQTLKSDVDFLSNRWLFKYLTQILDEKMIDLVSHNPIRYLDNPISLNLNVETLLSTAFSAFDATVKPSAKVSIVIEVPVVDVFADMTGFIYARKEVQKLGYRVCLDGLTAASFTSIDREKLGLDLIKVQWNADIESDLQSKDSLALADAVRACGGNRVILCRCDNRQAVQYGQALGISLFQGRYIDSVLNPTSKVEN